jgi:HEAT repeat protein
VDDPHFYGVRALGRIGDPRAIEPLADVMLGRSWRSDAALQALASIGDHRVVPYLGRMLHPSRGGSVTSTDCAAARLLARLSAPDDVDTLCDAADRLAKKNPDDSYQDQINSTHQLLIVRICALAEPRVIPRLLVPAHTAYVSPADLARCGSLAIPHLMSALRSDRGLHADKALEALVLLGPESIPALRARLPAPPSEYTSRCSIALCLLGVHEEMLIAPVVMALERGWSRPLALEALIQLSRQLHSPVLRTAIPVLRKLLMSWALVGHSDQRRTRCVRLLTRIEQRTDDLKSVPVVAAPPSAVANLPIVSPEGDP